MNVTVTWRSGGSVSAGGISVRQVFGRSWVCKRLFAHCVFHVGSDPTVSPFLCADVLGPLRELQKSGKDLALLKWWAVIPTVQSRTEIHPAPRRGFSSVSSESPSSCSDAAVHSWLRLNNYRSFTLDVTLNPAVSLKWL